MVETVAIEQEELMLKDLKSESGRKLLNSRQLAVLEEAGYRTAEDILEIATKRELSLLLTPKTAEKLWNTIANLLKPKTFKLASEMQQIRKARIEHLTTGSRELDELIGGGIETGSITEMAGSYGCHSEDTFVLTLDGIKSWREINVGDKILGVDDKGFICETTVEKKFVYDYSGILYHFSSRRYDLKVTPNHTVFFKKRCRKHFEAFTAEEVAEGKGFYEGHFPSRFGWKGDSQETFDIHKFIQMRPLQSRGSPNPKLEPLKTNLFLELLGCYIADGFPHRTARGHYVAFRAKKKRKREMIRTLLTKLNLKFSEYYDLSGSKFVVFHQDLAEYFKRCGIGATNKQIPREIFSLNRRHLEKLFDSLMKSDGSHGYQYYTSSKKLRDQMLILALAIGKTAFFTVRKYRFGGVIRNRLILQKHPQYYVNITPNPKAYYCQKHNLKKEPYKGKVWCFKTTTGNFFTVRKGRVTLSGNSGKTEMAHQLSVNVQLPRERGGLEGSCLYFDTEKTFRPERIVEMARAAGLDPKEAVNRIVVAECYSSDHQIFLLNNSHEIVRRENVRLIVVDSLMAHFRSEYIGREALAERQQKLNQYMARLARMARKFNLAVFVTNQAVSSPDFFGAIQPTGGNVVAHSSVTRLWIRRPKAMSSLRIVRLTESPYLPTGEAVFKITSEGVRDKEEDEE